MTEDLTSQESAALLAWMKERYAEWRFEGPTIDEECPGLRKAIRKVMKRLRAEEGNNR